MKKNEIVFKGTTLSMRSLLIQYVHYFLFSLFRSPIKHLFTPFFLYYYADHSFQVNHPTKMKRTGNDLKRTKYCFLLQSSK